MIVTCKLDDYSDPGGPIEEAVEVSRPEKGSWYHVELSIGELKTLLDGRDLIHAVLSCMREEPE